MHFRPRVAKVFFRLRCVNNSPPQKCEQFLFPGPRPRPMSHYVCPVCSSVFAHRASACDHLARALRHGRCLANRSASAATAQEPSSLVCGVPMLAGAAFGGGAAGVYHDGSIWTPSLCWHSSNTDLTSSRKQPVLVLFPYCWPVFAKPLEAVSGWTQARCCASTRQ